MSIEEIATRTFNPRVRQATRFPSVDVDDKEGYLFYLEMVPVSTLVPNTYFTIVAVIETDDGEIETNLEAKFYPKGRRLMFGVAIPEGRNFRRTSCYIEVEPKQRTRGPVFDGDVTIRCLYDDDGRQKADTIPI